jgi:hypothetical protein
MTSLEVGSSVSEISGRDLEIEMIFVAADPADLS